MQVLIKPGVPERTWTLFKLIKFTYEVSRINGNTVTCSVNHTFCCSQKEVVFLHTTNLQKYFHFYSLLKNTWFLYIFNTIGTEPKLARDNRRHYSKASQIPRKLFNSVEAYRKTRWAYWASFTPLNLNFDKLGRFSAIVGEQSFAIILLLILITCVRSEVVE